jgi:DNA-binding transcriptional LysR family regulator
MKLFQLHYFCTACLYRNITRAAEALHVSQPSVSLAIQALESEFDVPLLDREARGFVLTPDGEYLYREGQALLKRSNAITDMMAERKRLGAAVMRFGATPMAGAGITQKLYRTLGGDGGSLSVHLVEGGRPRLLRMIDEDLLDFALMPVNCLSPEKYGVFELSRKEVVLCVSAASPIAKLKRLESPAQLADVPLALFDDKYFFTSLVLDYFKRFGQSPRIVCYAEQIYTVLDFVLSGAAAAFLCRPLNAGRPDVVEIPLAEPMALQTGFVWKKSSPRIAELEREIERLAGELKAKK